MMPTKNGAMSSTIDGVSSAVDRRTGRRCEDERACSGYLMMLGILAKSKMDFNDHPSLP